MKAKDTVMSQEQLEKVEEDYLHEDFSTKVIALSRGRTEEFRLRVAQAQAALTARLKDEEWQEKIRELFKELETKILIVMEDALWTRTGTVKFSLRQLYQRFKEKWCKEGGDNGSKGYGSER